ncbi:NAD(P)H-binding protein [bacterium]|nr:NAD(P)H-binding protein [bacterium]
MKILLIGASGMIGSRILKEAASRGHDVIAAARHPEKIDNESAAQSVALDATDADAIARLAAGVDAIVSSVSPRGGGDPVEEATAVGDAVIQATEETGARLIVVGGGGSLKMPDGQYVLDTILPKEYHGEARGMREVFFRLQKTAIDWTYFCPPMVIAPGERTTNYRVGTSRLIQKDNGDSTISAEDFAHALIDELEDPKHLRSQMTVAY